jgi:hypothetical protein
VKIFFPLGNQENNLLNGRGYGKLAREYASLKHCLHLLFISSLFSNFLRDVSKNSINKILLSEHSKTAASGERKVIKANFEY